MSVYPELRVNLPPACTVMPGAVALAVMVTSCPVWMVTKLPDELGTIELCSQLLVPSLDEYHVEAVAQLPVL